MKNAKRVKNVNGMNQLMFDIKPNRCDSDVFINQKVDVTNLVKYVEKKKKENDGLTYFHAFLTAIGKTIYNRPKLNYFVQNRHLYEHNDIVISFVAKVSFDDKSEEVMILVPCEKDDNIDSSSLKVIDKVSAYRDKKAKKEGVDETNVRVATDMIKDGEPLNKILKYSKLTEAAVRKLAKSMGVAVL